MGTMTEKMMVRSKAVNLAERTAEREQQMADPKVETTVDQLDTSKGIQWADQ